MSLAEELLADLEDDEEELQQELEKRQQQQDATQQQQGPFGTVPFPGLEQMETDQDEKEEKDGEEKEGDKHKINLEDVAKLCDSEEVKSVLERMDNFSKRNRTASDLNGPVEADPEYLLIVQANNLAAELDNEVGEKQKRTVHNIRQA